MYNQLPINNPYINYNPYVYMNYNNNNNISCKIVESIDIVKTIEIPFNSFGLFIKADNSEVYYKYWNNDGTTRIITFIPVVENKSTTADIYKESLDNITTTLSQLSSKIDRLSPKSQTPNKEVRNNG